jgi:large subunit ribosomal protein L24
VTLAGGTLQSLRGDLKLDGNGWDIETLEMRAPGFAQVRLSGRMAQTADGISFKGPANVEANEPRMFAAWLEGRPDALSGPSGMLRVAGDLTVGAQEFAVERLKFEFDRKAVEGRFAYAGASGAKPPRLDAELKAAELDVDGVMAFGRAALDGTAIEWPREVSVAVDVARATVAGIDVKGVSGTFKLDPAGLTFDKVRIADLADASFSLNGRMEGALDAPRGTVTFDVDARGLDGTVAVLAKFLPQVAEPVRQAAMKIMPLKARATLAIEPVSSTNLRGDSKVKLALEGTGGALRMKFNTEAAGDIAALTLPEFRLDGLIAAADGTALTTLLGLDRVLNVDKRPGALNVAIRSAPGGDATLDARIMAGGLSASAIGTARLFSASGLSAALDLTLRSADAGPLRRGVAGAPVTLLPVALSAKLNATANDFALDGLNGSVGSSPVRGKLKLSLAPARTIEGQIDLDFLDAGALIAAAAGMPKSTRADAAKWPSEPFVESGLGDFSGRIQFSAKRASLIPTLTGQQLRGAVRFGSGEIAFEDVEGALAGGRANGQLVLRRGPDGLATRMKFVLAGAEATAMLPSEGRPAVSGRVGLSAELEGNGLSPASLVGSLTGSGTIALEDAQFASLDPRAFSAAISAADRGMAIDTPRIRDIVTTMLDGGALVVPRLDAAFAVNAGQARTGPLLIYAQGANLNLLANADLAESSFDARMTLFGPSVSDGANTTRPEILVTLKGPLAAPKRTVDVAALSAWLMLRSVERQAKHIDAIEAERRDFERREAERREAERRDAERREAERKEAERRDAEARAITSTVPAALPAPAIINEERTEPPTRIQRPRTTSPRVIEPAAPALPPPLSIGPAPGANAKSAPRPLTGQGGQIPPPPPRSSLDTLFGLQR